MLRTLRWPCALTGTALDPASNTAAVKDKSFIIYACVIDFSSFKT